MHTNTNINQGHAGLLKSRWFWIGLVGLVIILGGGWIIASRSWVEARSAAAKNGDTLDPAPVAGHPAPPIALSNLKGETVNLSDFNGKPVILNFWATWCGPCRAEFPEFQQAAVDNADELVIIGINNTTADNPGAIPGFLDEFGITFPILLDIEGDAAEAYNILGLPTTIFIDSNGVVNEVFTGPLNKAYIESKISELKTGL